MDFKLIGASCGQHGPYTFYKAFKYSKNGKTNILSLSEFFFVKLWNDSDLVSIGELQLLWEDKNSEQTLASLRLYILPESTPDGRSDYHGEDEVLAITEKVVIRVEDLLTWITEPSDWSWGLPAIWDRDCPGKMSVPPKRQLLSDYTAIDLTDVDKEKDQLDDAHWETSCGVVVLSFPRYCRYRGILKRLEGVQNKWLRTALVIALGGFTVPCRNTRVLFCKETFDYPDLEGHELLCNHLAPKLKGRPRRKRRKATLSLDGSESESESSLSTVSSVNKHTKTKPSTPSKPVQSPPVQQLPSQLSPVQQLSANPPPVLPPPEASTETITTVASKVGTRRSNRSSGSPEEKEFLSKLYLFMKSRQTPINRVPTIGFKEIDLYKFHTKVKLLGGYDIVTSSRLWKYVYKEMGGDRGNTSAATYSRRHYEKLLLPYERHLTGIATSRPKPSTIVSPRTSTDTVERTSSNISISPSSTVATITSSDSSRVTVVGKTSLLRSVRLKPEKTINEPPSNMNNPPRDKENIPIVTERSRPLPEIIDLISDESPTKMNSLTSGIFKKQKLEILKEGGLEVTPITTVSTVNGGPSRPIPSEEERPTVIRHALPSEKSREKISITVTPDVSHMLIANTAKAPQRHAWSLGSQSVYGNPKDIVHGDERRVNTGEVLDLRTKGNSRPSPSFGPIGSNLEITLVPAVPSSAVPQQRRKRSQPEQHPPIPHRLNNAPPRTILPTQKLVHQQRPVFQIPQRLCNPSVIPNGHVPHLSKKQPDLVIPNVSISVNQQQQNNQHHHLSQQQPKRVRHKAPTINHSFPNTHRFPGFKPPLAPYLPMVDPVYLSAALYSGFFPPNLFPSPASPTSTHHQLQLYKELMHRHLPTSACASFPDNFPRLLQDGSTSITLVGNSTTPTSK